jgi:hypothetical protein
MEIQGYAVCDPSSGIKRYYSAEVSRNLGVPTGGWTEELKRALGFARHRDAEEFRKTFLLAMAPFSETVPVTFEVKDPSPEAPTP